jgi:hypothetical protein
MRAKSKHTFAPIRMKQTGVRIMTELTRSSNARIWKYLIATLLLFGPIKASSRFVSEAFAWAIATFVMTLFLHLCPPRTTLSLVKVFLLALAAAVLLFGITKLIG